MDVDTVAVAGEWIRHAPHRSSLLGRASEATDGRWQHDAVVRALYLADEPATAIADGIACWPNADYRRAAPSLTTTTYGSSTCNSPTSAHRND